MLRANALEENVNFYKYVNGKRSTLHETSATFTAGRAGLWTKADSQTCFDDLTATAR